MGIKNYKAFITTIRQFSARDQYEMTDNIFLPINYFPLTI